jgi:2TM domain
MPEYYSQEDVQQILQLAIAKRAIDGDFSRVQLLEMADELGISPENLQQAETQWLAKQDEFKERQQFDIYRRNQLKQNFVRYLIVNVFLILVNLVLFKSANFGLTIALIWGLILALKTWKTYEMNSEEYENSFTKWRLKKQIGQSINLAFDKLLNPKP